MGGSVWREALPFAFGVGGSGEGNNQVTTKAQRHKAAAPPNGKGERPAGVGTPALQNGIAPRTGLPQGAGTRGEQIGQEDLR